MSSMEKAGFEGFEPQHLGDFEQGTKGVPAEQEPITDESVEEVRADGDKRVLAESLNKTGLNELAAGIEGLKGSDIKVIKDALNMIGSGMEIFVWIDPSKQAEAIGYINEILLSQDIAKKRNAAKGIFELSE